MDHRMAWPLAVLMPAWEASNSRSQRRQRDVSAWQPSKSREQLLSALRRLRARDGLPERVEVVLAHHEDYDDAGLFAVVWAAATDRTI